MKSIPVHGRFLLRVIRDVQNGRDPKGLIRETGTVIGTYSNDTIWRLPPAPTPEADIKLLQEAGRKVAEDLIKTGRPERGHAKQLV